MGRARTFFLFIWQMISPLIVYELISELVCAVLFLVVWPIYDPLIFTGLGALAALVPLIFWYRRWRAKDRTQVKPTPPYKLMLPEVLRLAALGMCLCVFLNILAMYVPLPWEEYDSVSSQIYREPVFLQLICVGLIVPFDEEMVFRALGYERMRTIIPAGWAVVISSVFFGLFHGNLIQGLYAGTLGLFMAAAMERYKTVMAPYVLHACANMMSVFLTETLINDLLSFRTPFRLAAMAVSGILTVLLIMDIRKEEPFNEETVDYSGSLL